MTSDKTPEEHLSDFRKQRIRDLEGVYREGTGLMRDRGFNDPLGKAMHDYANDEYRKLMADGKAD